MERLLFDSRNPEFGRDGKNEQIFGVRFDGIRVPRRGRILHADVNFIPIKSDNGPLIMRIRAELPTNKVREYTRILDYLRTLCVGV